VPLLRRHPPRRHVRPGQTSSGEARRVELDSTTVGVLLAHQVQQQTERDEWGEAYTDHGIVFAREDGSPLALDVVTKRSRELAHEAGLRLVRLHDLRHGAASLRLTSGADIAAVSKVLRHSSVAITSDAYRRLLAPARLDLRDELLHVLVALGVLQALLVRPWLPSALGTDADLAQHLFSPPVAPSRGMVTGW
jgi:integrase